jgi:hypothetical protein
MQEVHSFIIDGIIRNMDALSRIVAKAEVHSKEKNIPEGDILGWKLWEDMFDFRKQIQVATDDARRNLFLLAGKEHSKFEDNETTLVALQERIKKTKDLIKTLRVEDLDGAEDRHISLYWMGDSYVLGKDFIHEFVLPNNTFHVVTAYDILRSNGVAIGKVDFSGGLSMQKK